MSIEASYPSRRQPRSANPLFARERRRKQTFGLIAATGALAGLLTLALLPAPQAPLVEGRSVAAMPVPDVSVAPAPKAVRIIPL